MVLNDFYNISIYDIRFIELGGKILLSGEPDYEKLVLQKMAEWILIGLAICTVG